VTSKTNPKHVDNLPASLSPFIGRKREIAEVRRLIEGHRLLTLTGPGGCGKTRLAIEVARGLVADYEDGVWLTELASLTDPALVAQAVASSLGVRERVSGSVTDSLISHLQTRNALLLIDNCEHILHGCAQFSRKLLESCPGMHVLTTSREPLGVRGEAVFTVPPLLLPDPQPWRNPASEQNRLSRYKRSEAVQLFLTCASAAVPAFILTAENISWVVNICRRLDGIPLAIELAASQVRAYSPRQIAERLDDRFQILVRGAHNAPDRHRTLQATLDWSYDLLNEGERDAFHQLSIFLGGWTLEAAEGICASGGGRADLMAMLSSLVDKSLVAAETFQERRRYRYLETIRMYARQKLDESGETEAILDRHLDYFTRWADRNAKHLVGSDQPVWIEQFLKEHDNLRSALEWSQTSPERATLGLRLAGACGQFWRLSGYFSEGRARLSRALEHPAAQQRNTYRTQALHWAANLAYIQSDYKATRLHAEEELALSKELGPAGKKGIASALDMLGELATEIGDYENAPKLFEKALQINREIGNKAGAADMLLQLGWSAMRSGDFDQAEIRLTESLPLFRELGVLPYLALAQAGLGELAVRQGRYVQAVELLEESLTLRRKMGEQWGMAASLGSLGWVAMLQSDFSRMRKLIGESLSIRMQIGDRGGIAWCLEKLAEASMLQAKILPYQHRKIGYQKAVRLYGAARALRKQLNSVIDPADQTHYDKMVEMLKDALDEKAFRSAWAEGAAAPLDGIIEHALAPLITPQDVNALSKAQTAKVKYGGLSVREREAAILIAQGKTNRDIAVTMVVREKTVETYVTRILNKLGFHSRVQIATWAIEVGLVNAKTDN
jgi:predicted ATPase/DNA-binding CsgD family transcriptional regulator